MSMTDEVIGFYEAKRHAVEFIAIEKGIYVCCSFSGRLWAPLDVDPEPAYKRANQLISSGDPLVAVFKGNRRELTDMLKEVVEHPDYGPECDCPCCSSRD